MMWAEDAFHKLISDYKFETVLDIGCGQGEHSRRFREAGKIVTGIDYGKSVYFRDNPDKENVIIGDFNKSTSLNLYDCVWASHVLEHQKNVGLFLGNVYDACKYDGVVAITVPPAHSAVLGGHLTIWNAGLLLYNMILAGFDCKDAKIKSYGFNVSVIVVKKSAELPELEYDNGDVNRISEFFPGDFRETFDGNIKELNWDH